MPSQTGQKPCAGLKRAYRENKLSLPGDLHFLTDKKTIHAFLRVLHQRQWVVYAKPPFGGANHVLNNLARYTHRVAIFNHRLAALSDGKVRLRLLQPYPGLCAAAALRLFSKLPIESNLRSHRPFNPA